MAEVPEDDEYNAAYEAEVMQESVDELAKAVVGSRIVKVESWDAPKVFASGYSMAGNKVLVLTLDSGREVTLEDTDDCCAFTEAESFEFLVRGNHVITRVEADDGFENWFIYAEEVPVANLKVAWSPGNPYYYGFGFNIRVKESK